MKIPKLNEDIIKRDKELALQKLTEIHAKLAFEGETILDFDEYLLALAMFPISIEEQARMKGLSGIEEIMTLIAHYLDTYHLYNEE
tara:strand:- start:933 stop:1190 length:258 start_codon:yes stop_codon:yes gene_type:complete